MKPLFANSATVNVPEDYVLKGGRRTKITLGVRFGVWVHPEQGPVLIDTGYGPEVTQGKRSVPLRLYSTIFKPVLLDQPEDILATMGFTAEDVRTIILTHYHADHISGLRRFPKARFMAASWHILKQQGAWHRLRHGVFCELIPPDFEDRLTPIETCPLVTLPFGKAHDLFDDGRLLALPLPGHAAGHCGIVWPDEKLIYAADAQWLEKAITENRPPRGLARQVYEDEAAMLSSLTVLREAQAAGYEIRTCHDPAD